MVVSAAGIYAGAFLVGLIETVIPGGPVISLVPGIAALILIPVTLLAGPRVPRWALGGLGMLGTVLIAYAVATTTGFGDAAVLYMWPVLWMSYFFGRGGTALIVAWVGLAHAAALVALPPGAGNVDRWVDVVASVLVVGVVVRFLAERNERLVSELVAEARVDPLTGLLNRRGFAERMEVEVARARREAYPLAVIALDLDHFKRVNDAHGHEVGDRVLNWVGSVLSEHARGGDVVARAGGEEFVVSLPRADAAEARAVAERIRRAIAAPSAGRGCHGISAELAVTISAGVAVSSGPLHVDDLLEAADRALYSAKDGGRNRTEMESAATERERPRSLVATIGT